MTTSIQRAINRPERFHGRVELNTDSLPILGISPVPQPSHRLISNLASCTYPKTLPNLAIPMLRRSPSNPQNLENPPLTLAFDQRALRLSLSICTPHDIAPQTPLIQAIPLSTRK